MVKRDFRHGLAWRLRELGVVIALATVLALTLHQPVAPPPARLVLEPGLLARLQTLAAGLQREIVLCLTGTQYGDSTVADGFTMPDPGLSASDRATFGPCPKAAVAIWHNHPREYRGVDPNVSARALCALSETDIGSVTRSEQPFVVVAVDRDTWCWWSREQVRNLAASNALRGDPILGQISTYQGTSPRIY